MLYVDIDKRLGDFHLRAKFETDNEVMGVLGASGCGKSMTLRCIAGIEKPDAGRIVLDGVTLFDSEKGVNLPPQKRQVGYLFQNYALFPNMTVKKNIRCGLHGEKDEAKKQKMYRDAIALMQLEGLEKHRPIQLSGGQAQRAALARILVNQPKLLMLDEPFSALDTHLRDRLQIDIKRMLEAYEGSVLMVTHSRNEAYNLCSQIALMDAGTILVQKPTKQLFADPGSIAGAMMTGCKNIARAHKVGENLVEVPDWGVRYVTRDPVGDDLHAVGLRAHYFNSRSRQNRYAVSQVDEMEEPFEWVIRFRYAQQSPESEDIWWRLPKERKEETMPEELGIAPSNILLLYPAQGDGMHKDWQI